MSRWRHALLAAVALASCGPPDGPVLRVAVERSPEGYAFVAGNLASLPSVASGRLARRAVELAVAAGVDRFAAAHPELTDVAGSVRRSVVFEVVDAPSFWVADSAIGPTWATGSFRWEETPLGPRGLVVLALDAGSKNPLPAVEHEVSNLWGLDRD